MKKVLSLVLVVLTLISFVGITAVAVEPRWNNTNTANVSLSVSGAGIATVAFNCTGKTGVTTGITAETKLERKWGILWLDVDGAEWIDTTSKIYMSTSHTFQLSKTGTYRATTKFTVSGTGGSNDSITVRSEYIYE